MAAAAEAHGVDRLRCIAQREAPADAPAVDEHDGMGAEVALFVEQPRSRGGFARAASSASRSVVAAGTSNSGVSVKRRRCGGNMTWAAAG